MNLTWSSILSIVLSALLTFLVRFLNIILEWIAKSLGVEPVEDIPFNQQTIDHANRREVEIPQESNRPDNPPP